MSPGTGRAASSSSRSRRGTRRTSMRDALHAEWTKLRTAAGTGWLLLAAVALTVAVSAAAAATVAARPGCCRSDPAKLSLTGIYLGQAVVAILAVLAVSGEYSTGMIRDHADRDAAPGHRAGRQGGHPHRPGAGRREPWPCSARCWPGG